MQRRVLGLLVLSATGALAKTDIGGCVSSTATENGGASLVWYMPDTGEVCEMLDCGGGRAPPKTTVPGCPAYEGTETYSPKFLPGFEATTTDEEPAASTDHISNSGSGAEDSAVTPTSTPAATSSTAAETGSAETPTTAAETGIGASSDIAAPTSSSKSKALETGTGILTATEAASTDALVTAPPGAAETTAPSGGASSNDSADSSSEDSSSENSSSDESSTDSSADAGRNGSGSVPDSLAATVGSQALGMAIVAFGLVAGIVVA